MVKNVTQIKFGITINVNGFKKGHIWTPAKCTCENGKYLGSLIDNSVICEETIETTKTFSTKNISKSLDEK